MFRIVRAIDRNTQIIPPKKKKQKAHGWLDDQLDADHTRYPDKSEEPSEQFHGH